jgi:(p)ppGpp synthase/HD superfamily hydrolase
MDRFVEAVEFAVSAHAGQTRKGTQIPYLAHLLAVAANAMEDGADEEFTIAALLHDVVEDTRYSVADVEARFGSKVANIVRACSDTEVVPKPPWRQRKERYLDHLRGLDPRADVAALTVSLADKRHNARCIVADYRVHGEALWERFRTGSGDDQLWYYRSLADVFTAQHPGPAADDLARTVAELAALVRG